MEDIPLTLPTDPKTTVKRLYFIRHGETASNALGVLQGSGTNSSLNDRVRHLLLTHAAPLTTLPSANKNRAWNRRHIFETFCRPSRQTWSSPRSSSGQRRRPKSSFKNSVQTLRSFPFQISEKSLGAQWKAQKRPMCTISLRLGMTAILKVRFIFCIFS